MYTLSEKIEIIQNAGSLREVQDSGIMPDPDAGEGYYFISYSHKITNKFFVQCCPCRTKVSNCGMTAVWKREKAG